MSLRFRRPTQSIASPPVVAEVSAGGPVLDGSVPTASIPAAVVLGEAAPALALPGVAPASNPPQPAAPPATAPMAAAPDAPAPQTAASALAAAGVTELVGESVVEAMPIARPAGQTPPSPERLKDAAKPYAPATDASSADVDAGRRQARPRLRQTRKAGRRRRRGRRLRRARAPDGAGKARSPAASASADRATPILQTAAAPATSAGQNTQAAAGANAAVAAQVAVQVATDIAHGAGARRTRFEIRLDPDDLGRIDVRLDIAHDGRIATRLIVEKAETHDLLKQDSRELQRQLEQSGFQLGQSGLSFQLKDGRRHDWRALADANGVLAGSLEPDEEIAPAVDIYARAARRGGAGVDVTA